MKKLFTLLFMMLLAVTTINAQKLWGIVNDPDGYTNIRKGPGTKYAVAYKATSGNAICYTKQSGGWYKVYGWDCDQLWPYGYMHSSRIVAAPAGCTVYRVEDRDGYVNVRKGAGTNTAVVSKILSGKYVFASKAMTNNWRKVYNIKGVLLGYVHSSRLNANPDYLLY